MAAGRLDTGSIIETAQRLAARIDDRFADRGISAVAHEVVTLSRDTSQQVRRLGQPRWVVRGLILALFAAAMAVAVLWGSRVRGGFRVEGVDEWLAVLQDGIQDLVFVGVAAVFLVGLEGRLKRREALTWLQELRSVDRGSAGDQGTRTTRPKAWRPSR